MWARLFKCNKFVFGCVAQGTFKTPPFHRLLKERFRTLRFRYFPGSLINLFRQIILYPHLLDLIKLSFN